MVSVHCDTYPIRRNGWCSCEKPSSHRSSQNVIIRGFQAFILLSFWQRDIVINWKKRVYWFRQFKRKIDKRSGRERSRGRHYILLDYWKQSQCIFWKRAFIFFLTYMHLFNYMHLLEQKEEQLAPLDRSNIQRKHNICIDINW